MILRPGCASLARAGTSAGLGQIRLAGGVASSASRAGSAPATSSAPTAPAAPAAARSAVGLDAGLDTGLRNTRSTHSPSASDSASASSSVSAPRSPSASPSASTFPSPSPSEPVSSSAPVPAPPQDYASSLIRARTGLQSRWAVLLVALAVKAFAKLCCPSFQVHGMERFLHLLRDQQRRAQGRGIVTFANHISTFDEPLLWASMPLRSFLRPDETRWTLGARDVIFTNAFLCRFFEAGQVIPTNRGQGIFQRAVDEGVDLLQRGHWVHIFPEGYVNLSTTMTLRRFKWGVSRLLLEAAGAELASPPLPLVSSAGDRGPPASPPTFVSSPASNVYTNSADAAPGSDTGEDSGEAKVSSTSPSPVAAPVSLSRLPVVLPIWLTGFDHIMPEQRRWPRWLPRPGASISIHFGAPIDPLEFKPFLDVYQRFLPRTNQTEVAVQGPSSPLTTPIPSSPSSSLSSASSAPSAPSATPAPPIHAALPSLPALPNIHPIPPPNFFPPRDPIPQPAEGWPAPERSSRAAKAAREDSTTKQAVRSALAAFLRFKLSELGVAVRRSRGEAGPGALAHRVGRYAKEAPMEKP